MKNEYRVGLFFMIGILVLVFIMDFLGEIPFYSNSRTVYTYFDTLGELREGNPVKLEGLVIGKVSTISLEDRKLKVTMEIDKDAPVKNDSVASIQLTSLLGTSYVNLTFGTADSADYYGNYPLPSIEPTDLNKILSKLDSAIGSIDTALGAFSGFGDDKEGINNIVTNLDIVLEDLASGKGTLGKLIKDDELYNEVTVAMKNLRNITTKLNDSGGTFGKLVNDDQLYDQAAGAATELNEILKKVNSGEGTLGKLVNDDSLYYDAKNTVIKVEKSVDTLEDLAPLGTLGAIFGVFPLLR
ncbi:MAG: MlaD family protein [Thermodesulfobacteriota bacterium]